MLPIDVEIWVAQNGTFERYRRNEAIFGFDEDLDTPDYPAVTLTPLRELWSALARLVANPGRGKADESSQLEARIKS